MYLQRPGETQFQSCPNVTETLEYHAGMLSSTGIDFMLLDATNLGTVSPSQDLLQQRPGEVIADMWTAYRASGHATPSFGSTCLESDGMLCLSVLICLYVSMSLRLSLCVRFISVSLDDTVCVA